LFLFRLALALGRTVAELESSLGSRELTEWLAYYKLEPFGQERDNWHTGVLASMYANVHKASGKPASKPSDFIYGAKDTTKERQTVSTFAALDSMAVNKDGSDKT